MRAPVLVLGFIFAWVAALAGCGDNSDGGGTNKPLGTEKEITAFSLLAANNPGLTSDVNATITGDTITATVPFGSDLTALVATFDTTGASVAVAGAAQTSGKTANDFSKILTYTVTAEDGSTRNYSATITAAASDAKAITAFSFTKAKNAGLSNDIAATINGTAIAATVPFGTDVTALIATYAATGTIVKVGAAPQTSGTTANNFTSPIAYAVTAADGTSATYTVTVTIAGSPAKDISAYSFTSALNAGLTADVLATINGTAITATVPFGTDVTGLVATFTSTGASVKVGTATQTSGTTANDFTSPVTYTVTAADGTTQSYTVAVTIAANPAKALTAFSFTSALNAGLTMDVTGTIDQAAHTIAVAVPFGTDVTGLVATFATTGTGVKVGGALQTSGTTANNFTTPVTYTVTAADNSTQDYVVTVTAALNNAKTLTAFSFLTASNSGLSMNVDGTINESNKTVTVTVPFGTNLTALVATFAASGASVTVGGTAQTSGITPNNFTAAVDYVVHAADGTTATYAVTVTAALNSAKAITAFAFTTVENSGLSGDAIVTITDTTISAVVPYGTSPATIKALIAKFTITGDSVTVGGVTQTSTSTANDFSAAVTYVVHAQDGTTASYTVTVTVADNPAKAIMSYQFAYSTAINPEIKTNEIGVIDEVNHTITVEVPPGINVKALVATFTAPNVASVKVGAVTQVSGTTGNDFTNPVTYTVTAADGTTQNYVVTVKFYVAQFSFTGYTGTTTTYPSDGVNLNLQTQPVMNRVGVSVNSASSVFNSSAWATTATVDPANKYITFTIAPLAGKQATLTQLRFLQQKSSTGPASISIRSSRDNFATDIGGVQTPTTGLTTVTLALDAATFSNLTTATEFRIFGVSATMSSGTYRVDDVQLSGTVQ